MLVLTRKVGESLIIGDNIEITILESNGDQIRVGVKAPKEIDIYRKEIFESIQKENEKAVQDVTNLQSLIQKHSGK